ncbi:hypothetical protein ABTE31_21790, partial [Acinetobacter baumannii]
MAAALETLAAGKPAYFSWQQLFAEPGAGAAPPLRRLILAQPKLDYGALQPGEDAVAAIQAQATKLGLDQA